MRNFTNRTYEALVRDLINDAFYLESRSRRGTISTIRQYAEVIVRKILDLPNNETMTLGDKRIVAQLKDISSNNDLLLESVDCIRRIGNKCTHTQTTDEITEDDVKLAIDKLFNLYAYLFIAYFQKYKFGSNTSVMEVFSILPPIIRFITLNYLYKNEKNNISIIDKLSLVALKAFDKETAIKWVEDRKHELLKMRPYTPEAIEEVRKKYGEAFAQQVIDNAPENMYVLCIDRINEVSEIIEQHGKLYDSFEQAKQLYLDKGIIEGNTEEINEFNSIMEFIYLGRKLFENEKLKNQHLYIKL
jgi:hypothetical protein